MHPALEEFCRINSLQNYRVDVFRRHQRIFRDEIQPALDERETLIEQNHQLREELAALKRTRTRGKASEAPATVAV